MILLIGSMQRLVDSQDLLTSLPKSALSFLDVESHGLTLASCWTVALVKSRTDLLAGSISCQRLVPPMEVIL